MEVSGRPCRGASDGPNSTQVPSNFLKSDNGFAEPRHHNIQGRDFILYLPLPDLDLHVYKFKHPFIRSRVFRLMPDRFAEPFDGLLAIVVEPSRFVLNVVNLFELALELLDDASQNVRERLANASPRTAFAVLILHRE